MFELTNIVIVLFFTTLINIAITSISWQRRKANHGWFFALGMVGVSLWTFASSLDYAAVPITLKVFFAKIEVIGYQSALTLFLVSIALYAGHEPWLKKSWVKVLLFAIPASNILIAWTNDLHGWFWSNFSASVVGENIVVFEHGPGFTWATLTAYLIVGILAAILLQLAIRGTVVLRNQARLLLLALLVPVASNLLYLFDAFNLPGVDWSSITFSITGALFLLVLYGTRFLEIIPIARNVLIDQMDDVILVLDSLGCLVDFNPAAQAVFGLDKSSLRKPPEVVFAGQPEIIELLKGRSEKIASEISLFNGETVFDIRMTSLKDHRSDVYGYLVVMRDISEGKQMEQALRESEAHFREVFGNTAHGTFIIEVTKDGDFRIGDSNKAEEILTTIRREDVMGKSLKDAFPSEIAQALHANYSRCLETGQAITYEEDVDLPGVGRKSYLTTLAPVKDESGRFHRIIGSTLEITERKQMEKALRESEEQHRLIVHTALDGFWQTDMQGRFMQVNDAYCQMSGYSEQELLSMNISDLDVNETPEVAAAHIQKTITQGQDRFETRHRRKDGKVIDIDVSVQYREGQFFAFLRDITGRKLAEEAVERGHKMLSAVLAILPLGVCLTDESGQYRMMNDAYCAIYEYNREEMLGQHYSVIMPPDQVALANAHYARLLSGDIGIPAERKRQRKDGSIIYIEAANALMENVEGQKMVITTVRDITERKIAGEIVQMRLQLWEYAATHSITELMQKALDEICSLTDSSIGFYHFVADDQSTLSLQAWSTRTLAEFCKAEGKGLHYPISEAGVWVDCVREQKPVIHNDYASLPHRKGMPVGHAEVVRELVVPTLHNERVVAILGVGNKPSDYDEKDVDLVSFIADLVWTIVDQKRADEEIHQLNAKLEQLAMTDELTGLLNRRSFFKRGAEEIKRSQRYRVPLSLLMMDIDGFKAVNDTYGHDAGDNALRCVASTLQRNIRDIDILARLGGEEFGILLPNTGAADAVKMAERLRMAVEQETCIGQDQRRSVTLSVGVAAFKKTMNDIDQLLNVADVAMYQAKNRGRNQVVLYA